MKSAKCPAVEHLFTINDKAKKLEEDKKEIFHTIVAKEGPNLQTAIAFLCTRVTSPD